LSEEKIGFFFGCTLTMLAKELYEDMKSLLRTARVEYVPLGINQCCGVPLILSGRTGEAKGYAERVLKNIVRNGWSLLVVACPHCYIAFSKEVSSFS